MPLQPGDRVSSLTAPNQSGQAIDLTFDELTVLYFYPEDGTPGCTTEAKQFTYELDVYRDAGIDVYGVSKDTVDSHREFADANDIEINLLADPDGRIADAFEVTRSAGGFDRTTFVLENNEVIRRYTDVSPDGHARTVLMDLLDDGIIDWDSIDI